MIGAGVNQVPVIAKARAMGLHVIAIDGNARAPGLTLADLHCVVSTRDKDAVIKFARAHRVNGVVSIASDLALPTVAAVAECLGVVGLSSKAAEVATHKGKMRQCLLSAGVASPAFGIAQSAEEAFEIAHRLGFPVVCKPVDRAGGHGITKVFDRIGLGEAFQKAARSSFAGQVVVEEFMTGPQVSVDFMVFHGQATIIGISDTEHSLPPHAVELRHIMPSSLPRETLQECEQLTLNAIRMVGLDNCAGFVEVMATKNGCKVIELAGRLSGLAENLVAVATGIDVTKAVIDIALGMEPDLTPVRDLAVAQVYIHPGETGAIKSISGIEAARKAAGIEYVDLWVTQGDQVVALTDNYGRTGRLAAVGPTRDQAISRAEYAVSLLQFAMDPPPEFKSFAGISNPAIS